MATTRYPLANDADGNPIKVPPEAVAWRVRRGGGTRGRPRVVFDSATGRQLEVPLTVTVEELVERGCPPGPYRLEAVDGEGRIISGVVGVTELGSLGEAAAVSEEDEVEEDGEDGGFNGHLIRRQLRTIERQNEVLFRAIDAMSSAFGPVRRVGPAIMGEATSGGEGDSGKSEKVVENIVSGVVSSVKTVADMWKGGGGEGAGGSES